MKNIFLFSISLISVVILSSHSTFTITTEDRNPAIFEHSNCRGQYAYLNVSRSNFKNYGWNDKVSSIEVPYGWKLVFYEHKDYCGRTFTVYPGTHNFKDYGWNDKVSSVKVYYNGKLQGYAYSCPHTKNYGPVDNHPGRDRDPGYEGRW
ncbi:MAG: beta/gamma crystallin-related protein [Bacteroidota bacterium]